MNERMAPAATNPPTTGSTPRFAPTRSIIAAIILPTTASPHA